MDSLPKINPVASVPASHAGDPGPNYEALESGSKSGHAPRDMAGPGDKGALWSMSGQDKAPSSGIVPGFVRNPTNPDMTYVIIRANLINAGLASLPIPAPNDAAQNLKELQRFWVGEKEPDEPRAVPDTLDFHTDIHEINKVQESSTDTDSGGGGEFYLPHQEAEEKFEQEKLEAEEVKDEIMVDEAFSWNGHVSEYHYSPEKLHTNSLEFISSMLPFRVPISHQ